MTGYLHLPDDDQLLHHIARQLVRDRSQGLCDENYPNPCSACDCFGGTHIRYAQLHAAEVLRVLRGLSVEPGRPAGLAQPERTDSP